jgi:hypothetical protein
VAKYYKRTPQPESLSINAPFGDWDNQADWLVGNLPTQTRYSLDSEPFVRTWKRLFYDIISTVEIDPKYKEIQ